MVRVRLLDEAEPALNVDRERGGEKRRDDARGALGKVEELLGFVRAQPLLEVRELGGVRARVREGYLMRGEAGQQVVSFKTQN